MMRTWLHQRGTPQPKHAQQRLRRHLRCFVPCLEAFEDRCVPSVLSAGTGAGITGTALISFPNPSDFGQRVDLTAQVTIGSPAAAGTGASPAAIIAPSGTVTFRDGPTVLSTAPLLSGRFAAIATATLSGGSHALTATYNGDSIWTPSTSPVLTHVVNRIASAVTVTSSRNPALFFFEPVTFTADVRAAAPGAGTPTGPVAFFAGSSKLGRATLTDGTATFTTSRLDEGSQAVRAVYLGDANFAGSTSPTLTQVITCTADMRYAAALYHSVLDRPFDPDDFRNWVGQLDAGASREQVARAFWESEEHRGLEVDRYYRRALRREADPGGRAHYVGRLLSGVGPAQVVTALLTSAEYAASHPDDASYLRGLYEDVLGRDPDPAGFDSHLRRVQSEARGRAEVAGVFLSSEEAHRRALEQVYREYLGVGRPVDQHRHGRPADDLVGDAAQ